METNETDRSGDAFYKFGGSIGRRRFFVNSLMVGIIFGIAFSVLFLGGGPASSGESGDIRYRFVENGIVATFLGGAMAGPVAVFLTGFTCVWLGLYYAFILVAGSPAGKPPGSELAPATSWVSGLMMAVLVALAYFNIAKRTRNILGSDQHAHRWGAGIWFLSLVPVLGTILYYGLLIVPGKKIEQPKEIELQPAVNNPPAEESNEPVTAEDTGSVEQDDTQKST